jgi:hypothetical protein
MKFISDKILDAGSMGADVESDEVLIDQIYGFAIQAVYTGTPNGTLKIQASCDDVQKSSDVTNWIDVSGATATITAAGSVIIQVPYAFYKWFKVVFVRTSGTGSLTITYNGKG